MAGVAADPPDVDLVAAGGVDRLRVESASWIVQDRHARRRTQELARALGRERASRLHVDRLGVARDDGDAYAGGADPDRGIAEDLARLVHHLALLVGVIVPVGEGARVRERVEGDLVRVLLGRRDLALVQQSVGLLEQLLHRAPAGARYGLVGADHEPLDPRLVVDRLERHHHLHRRAVGIGDDAAALALGGEQAERVGVHLADHERHVLVHAPARGVVDHDRSSLGEGGRPLARGRAPGGEQSHVEALDRLLAESAHDEPALELAPDRALGGERDDLAGGELPLAQQAQHQRAHLPGGAHDRYPVPLAAHQRSGYRDAPSAGGAAAAPALSGARARRGAARRVSPRRGWACSALPSGSPRRRGSSSGRTGRPR